MDDPHPNKVRARAKALGNENLEARALEDAGAAAGNGIGAHCVTVFFVRSWLRRRAQLRAVI
jgi:hypothetical protein